jgi:glycine/D-amino acid oxidase-like deaminating enzyme
MIGVYPQLRGVKIDFEWGGKIGIVLNRVLAVGRNNGNVYYCQDYSGHGVNGTHVMGEIMADAVGGTMEKFDLFAGLKPVRIPGSKCVGNQIIALGMLFYRMKDRL